MMRSTLFVAGLLTAGLSAQQIELESFTDTSKWSSSNSGAVVNDARSSFGKLYKITSAATFSFTRTVTLKPGTYVATARFLKATSATGAGPITIRASGVGNNSVTVPVAAQTIDEFIWSVSCTFEVVAGGPVIFNVGNTDANVEQDYYFDAFEVGKVEAGRAVLVQSLGRRFGHAWGAPHYCKEHPDPTSTFGFVERLNPPGSQNCGTSGANLWWFNWNSPALSFPVGTYTGNYRIKKVVSTTGAHNFLYSVRVSTDGGQNYTVLKTVLWDKRQHPVDQWVYSPNLSIDVTDPTHLYRFRIYATGNHAGLGQTNSVKGDYYFDTFEVREGRNDGEGSSCLNNNGAELRGYVPQTGQDMIWTAGPLPGGSIANLNIGVANLNVDLSIAGWAGCWLYTDLLIVVPMSTSNAGFGTLAAAIPSSPSLIGTKFSQQAWAVNGGRVETTNALRAEVKN